MLSKVFLGAATLNPAVALFPAFQRDVLRPSRGSALSPVVAFLGLRLLAPELITVDMWKHVMRLTPVAT